MQSHEIKKHGKQGGFSIYALLNIRKFSCEMNSKYQMFQFASIPNLQICDREHHINVTTTLVETYT